MPFFWWQKLPLVRMKVQPFPFHRRLEPNRHIFELTRPWSPEKTSENGLENILGSI